jgi:hypothetical protein
MSALSAELGLSEAIGALMAGIVLAEASVRTPVEERFFSFRDLSAPSPSSSGSRSTWGRSAAPGGC